MSQLFRSTQFNKSYIWPVTKAQNMSKVILLYKGRIATVIGEWKKSFFNITATWGTGIRHYNSPPTCSARPSPPQGQLPSISIRLTPFTYSAHPQLTSPLATTILVLFCCFLSNRLIFFKLCLVWFLDATYVWNHVCLSPPNFIQHGTFGVHPCCFKWQNFILFCGWVVVHYICLSLVELIALFLMQIHRESNNVCCS